MATTVIEDIRNPPTVVLLLYLHEAPLKCLSRS